MKRKTRMFFLSLPFVLSLSKHERIRMLFRPSRASGRTVVIGFNIFLSVAVVLFFCIGLRENVFAAGWLHKSPASSEESLPLDTGISRWPSAREQGAYEVRVSTNNRLLWQVEWETNVKKEGEKSQVEIHESGHGQPWSSSEPIVWEKEMSFEAAPELRFHSVEGTRWTTQGKLLSQLDIHADPQQRFIFYKDTINGEEKEFRFPWTDRTFPDELLFHWIRTLNFNHSPAGEYFLLVGPTRRLKMQAFVRGVETVTTPAGTFSCYRVEIFFRLGVLDLLPVKGLLVPKLTLWCTTEFPHHWVRYQGPVGGPGSPQVWITLTHFERTNS